MRMVALGYVAMSSAAAGAKTDILETKIAAYLATVSAALEATALENDRAIVVSH
jgi:hypothetical protein